jgi:hypothetical protein
VVYHNQEGEGIDSQCHLSLITEASCKVAIAVLPLVIMLKSLKLLLMDTVFKLSNTST